MDTRETIKYKNIASIVAIVALLLAIPSGFWPYGYFVLLRWVVAGIALFNLWAAYNLQKMGWVWIMGGIAILFNPILPIYLSKGMWIFIDLVVVFMFIASISKISTHDSNEQ